MECAQMQPPIDGTMETCRCVGKHIPKAMELQWHYVLPLVDGGPDNFKNLIILCPITHANIHRLWNLYDEYKGRPPWPILRGYSEYAREVVEKGRELRRIFQANQTVPNST